MIGPRRFEGISYNGEQVLDVAYFPWSASLVVEVRPMLAEEEYEVNGFSLELYDKYSAQAFEEHQEVCPKCGIQSSEPIEGASLLDSVERWECLMCGHEFYGFG